MRKLLSGTGIAGGVAALLIAATGTATAAPVGWNMPGGQGSTSGSVEFYNRSVGVTGTVQSHIGGCIQVQITTFPGANYETRTACNTHSTGFNFTMVTDFPGGASSVDVSLYHLLDDSGAVEWLGSKTLNRP
ncbi:hypothetical protein ACFUCQ_21645 [Streptomyces sp. NPDC057197]|uniref:hypothetical protein n=1 Tax=unclassified Streptomyces TaxID=2593676 RepID=UPI0007DE1C95|nr:hypothetical protein [Streptomyces sp. SAT1]ANH92519.1 hypothetical protein A8713_16250 [Streptomyces sp. SAT1]